MFIKKNALSGIIRKYFIIKITLFLSFILAPPLAEAEVVFHLIEDLSFTDGTEISDISKSDISQLKERTIKLGPNTHIDGLRFQNDKGDEIIVSTCRDFEHAIKNGFHARSNFELKMSAFFTHPCGLLSALETATLPTQSYISDPKVGISNFDLLPYSLFSRLTPGPNEPIENPQQTYQDQLTNGSLVVKKIEDNLLLIEEPEGFGQKLVEVVRADFNSDRIEDILLYEYSYATQGTFGHGDIVILTRKSPDSLFEVVPLTFSQ